MVARTSTAQSRCAVPAQETTLSTRMPSLSATLSERPFPGTISE